MSEPAKIDGPGNGMLPEKQPSQGSVASERVVGSGHSWLRKSQFAGTLSSIFLGLALANPAKDFYLEKFGASPLVMGGVFFVVSFLSPVNEIISGRLQQAAVLKRCFPLERWGRKAPWLYTHTVLLALSAAALYLPPSRDQYLLNGWFFLVSVVMFWAVSTMVIAFESTRQELYPYNEERSQVEFLCKISVAIGIAIAALPLLVLLSNAALWLRAGASALFFLCIVALGLQSKSVWLEAKSQNITEAAPNIIRDFKLTWRNYAFRHLACVRLWEGMYQGLQATNLWYYVTYIMQLHGVIRSLAVVGIGALNMAADTLVACFVQRWMTKRESSFRVQSLVVRCRIVNVIVTVLFGVLPVIISGSGPHAPSSTGLLVERVLFVAWVTINRGLQGPFTFWRVGAQCWVVDEDIHTAQGERREAAYISVASAAQNFTRAFSGAMGFLGYGLVGFAPKDCEGVCAEAAKEALEESFNCLDTCMDESIIMQPDSLRWYIRLVNIVALTVSEIFLVYHTWAYPIKGIRLARLYNNQTISYGGKVETGSAERQMAKLTCALSPTLDKLVEAQHGTSVELMADDPAAGREHVSRLLQRKGATRGVSASVIFSDLAHSIGVAPVGAPMPSCAAVQIPQEDRLTLKKPFEFPVVGLLRASGSPPISDRPKGLDCVDPEIDDKPAS